jgi:hypothetical protein
MEAVMRSVLFFCLVAILSMNCGHQMEPFQELVKELDETEQEIRTKQESIRSRIQEYNADNPKKQIDTETLNRMVLDSDQAEALSQRLGQEKNVSYRGLIQEIVDTHKQVDILQERIRLLQESLPAPYTVQSGDRHLDVALRYLMENHGLRANQAREAVAQVALVEDLHVGYKIWLLYRDGDFGTYVTQGTASISPGKAQRTAKQRIANRIATLVEERNTAQIFADTLQILHDNLQERILFLRSEESQLQSRIATLAQARDAALAKSDMAEQQGRMLEQQLNSIFYAVNTMDHWKELGVISDPFFGGPRVKSLAKVRFSESHDLRAGNILAFSTLTFPELKRIKKVDVFPRTFKDGQEYIVSFDESGDQAFVKLLKPDVFLAQRVIFALRD